MAAVRIRGRGLRMAAQLMGHMHVDYPADLRRRLLAAMCPAETTTQELAALHADLGRFLGRVGRRAIRALTRGQRPHLIGSHGQTIAHLPGRPGGPATLQIGEAAWIAQATGCPVVSDFRQADMAAGGEGAPLVPWTDWLLFRDRHRSRAVQNIGGIANVTYLPAGRGPEAVIAFDTGPGNMIIDELVRVATRGRQTFDRDGRLAARGRVLDGVLARWMGLPYFRRRPPKTAGREEFGRGFVARELPRLRAASDRPEDWIATATAFAAKSIADAYRRFLPRRDGPAGAGARAAGRGPAIDEVLVCGGGAANPALLSMLAGHLPAVVIRSIQAYGIPPQAKEPLSFAMLAAAFEDGVPANLPQVTGARRPAVLGKLCKV